MWKLNTHEMTFGDILKRERTNRGLSLRELAEVSGIEASYINRLEKGNRDNPGFVTVCALASAMELNGEEILKSFGYDSLGTNTKSDYSEVQSFIHSYVTSTDHSNGYIPKIITLIEELKMNYQSQTIKN